MKSKEMQDTAKEAFEAAGGDSVIAAALIQREGLDAIAKALDRLGLYYDKADGPPGAVEGLAIEVRDGLRAHAEVMERVVTALEGADE